MKPSHSERSSVAAVVAAFVLALQVSPGGNAARAHPLSQGALDVVVHPERVSVRARVTLEEVGITDLLTNPAAATAGETGGAAVRAACARHARYMTEHLRVAADGRPLAGRVVRVAEPGAGAALPPADAASTPPGAAPPPARPEDHVVYELEYAPADAAQALSRPRAVEFRQDMLVGVDFAPGVTWEVSYVLRVGPEGRPATQGLLLTTNAPVVYECDWDAAPAAPGGGGAAPAARVDGWRLARDYAAHGVHHILSGYDHLLFIGALVLAAASLWDLVKVVSAFTLAHTITLLLSALGVVRLPSWVVEPLIAASIVFVAAQNVFWPKQARGWGRLAAAFFFGLFHGLGYAGGLIEAMQELSTTTVLLAIAAFSVGVEVGHQVVVIPLFALLKLARRTRTSPEGRDRVSLSALRYGSAVICVAGVYYLAMAVASGLPGAGRS